MRKSTLVSIAVTFLVASAAVIWICYLSFRSSVMSFEDTNAPGGAQAQVTPVPLHVPLRLPVVAAPTPAPTEEPALNPALIPTMAPIVVPRSTPGRPNGPPPPDA